MQEQLKFLGCLGAIHQGISCLETVFLLTVIFSLQHLIQGEKLFTVFVSDTMETWRLEYNAGTKRWQHMH